MWVNVNAMGGETVEGKPQYVIVEGEWKIVYSTPNFEQAKSVIKSYQKIPKSFYRYYRLYEMTELEVKDDTEEVR